MEQGESSSGNQSSKISVVSDNDEQISQHNDEDDIDECSSE